MRKDRGFSINPWFVVAATLALFIAVLLFHMYEIHDRVITTPKVIGTYSRELSVGKSMSIVFDHDNKYYIYDSDNNYLEGEYSVKEANSETHGTVVKLKDGKGEKEILLVNDTIYFWDNEKSMIFIYDKKSDVPFFVSRDTNV